MMKAILSLLLVLLSFYADAQSAIELSYNQSVFNSDTCCWRELSKQGKFQEAVLLLEDYMRNGNQPFNRQLFNWHTGQLWAMAGNAEKAVKYFHKTYNIFYKWFGGEDGKTWYYFAKGTSAFVNGNKHRLEHIIIKWKKKYKPDGNYKELTILYSNWGKPYAEAYKQ
ncbi:MAG: hypothetical protein JST82_07090 [Bacteroidetes bacterium]|nr:hypothetical protein [Bacteroidota bacterium]